MHKLTVLAPMATAFIALLALAPSAWAVDGVIEINHAKALAGGVTASDTPGYPVTIDSAGSYRLTGNLTVPDENTDGIVVSANDVGIDLNNFAIIRAGCEGATTSCAPASGTGTGVYVPLLHRGVSVKNGSITGMGLHGVYLGQQAEVASLRARWNRGYGIRVNKYSTVSGNTAVGNGHGISAPQSAIILGNTANGNSGSGVVPGHGIAAGAGSTVSRNTANDNAASGFHSSGNSTISGNTAWNNGSHGFDIDGHSTVLGNTSTGNSGDGIRVGASSTVTGNTVSFNSGRGLDMVGCGYSGNVAANNALGSVTAGSLELGPNMCEGSTTCP